MNINGILVPLAPYIDWKQTLLFGIFNESIYTREFAEIILPSLNIGTNRNITNKLKLTKNQYAQIIAHADNINNNEFHNAKEV